MGNFNTELKCKDTRRCCFRANDPKYKNGCLILNEAYKEDGECPFCKDKKDKIVRKTPKPPKKVEPEKPKREIPLPDNDVILELMNRIRFCANLYPNNWEKEYRFLNSLLTMAKRLVKLESENEWYDVKDKPEVNEPLLLTVKWSGEDVYGDAIYGLEVTDGFYDGEEYCINLDTHIYKVIGWRYAPEPYEGSEA